MIEEIQIRVSGAVISNNLEAVMAAILAKAEEINTNPQTDEEYGQAIEDVKAIEAIETGLKAVKRQIDDDMGDVGKVKRAIDEGLQILAKIRLATSKNIEKGKEEKKAGMVSAAFGQIVNGRSGASSEYLKIKTALAESIKKLRTLTSINRTLETEVGIWIDRLNLHAGIIQEFIDQHGAVMIPDRPQLEMLETEVLKLTIARRADSIRAIQERAKNEERLKVIQAEEAQKRAEVEAKLKQVQTQEQPQQQSAEPVRQDISQWSEDWKDKKDATASESREEEWSRFMADLKAAFGAVKAARLRLSHEVNKQKALAMAMAFNQAFESNK
jgi:hypothetical protein